MDPVTGGLILGGVGAGLSYFGQREANRANIAWGREQMQWQERMMNTAHQREVDDLRAAGLNPILSAGGGASSPSGVSVEQQNAVPDMGGLASTAIQAQRLREDINAIRANTDKTKQDTKTSAAAQKMNEAAAMKTAADAVRSQAEADFINWAKEGGAKIMDKFGLSRTNAMETLRDLSSPGVLYGKPKPFKLEQRKD